MSKGWSAPKNKFTMKVRNMGDFSYTVEIWVDAGGGKEKLLERPQDFFLKSEAIAYVRSVCEYEPVKRARITASRICWVDCNVQTYKGGDDE